MATLKVQAIDLRTEKTYIAYIKGDNRMEVLDNAMDFFSDKLNADNDEFEVNIISSRVNDNVYARYNH